MCSHPDAAGEICRRLASEVKIPILAKICYQPEDKIRALFFAVYKHVRAFTAINTIPANIMADGQRAEALFSGSERSRAGVSGTAIRQHALEAAMSLRKLAKEYRKDLEIIGVGGISSAEDVRAHLDAGTSVVQLCTAVNLNPLIGQQIRKQLASPASDIPAAKFGGNVVMFSDPNVKEAFQATSEVCNHLGIPFDVGLKALQQNWLDRYERDRAGLRATTNAARGKAPGKDDIEQWIRYAVNHPRRR